MLEQQNNSPLKFITYFQLIAYLFVTFKVFSVLFILIVSYVIQQKMEIIKSIVNLLCEQN